MFDGSNLNAVGSLKAGTQSVLTAGGAVTTPCPACPIFPPATPLPTFTRDTSPVIFHSIQAGANLGGHNSADLFVQVVNGMIATGIWACAYSCDGNVMSPVNSGINLLVDYTDWIGTGGGGAGFSFIVLTNVFTGEQLIFRCTVSGTAWTEINVWFCPLGGATGGTVTVAPTAPVMISPAAQLGQWLGTGPAPAPDDNPQFHAAVWCAPDGAYTRVAWSYAGKLLSFWQFDQLFNTPAPWTTPRLYHFMTTGNDYVHPSARYLTSSWGLAWSSGGYLKQSIIPGGTVVNWSAGIAEAQRAGAVNYANRVIAVAADWAGVTAKYPWFDPMGVINVGAVGTNGFGGHVVDQFWTVPVFNDFDTSGGGAVVMIGDQMLQWNGLSGSVMGGVSVDTPAASFYGRSTA